MVYQPIQRNLAFAAEFSGGTARVNGVPPPNISDQARSGQIVKETVFNLFWNLECPDSGRQREAVSFGRLVVCWNLQVSDFQTEGSRGGGSVWTCRFTPWKHTVQTAAGKRKDTVDVKSLHHWRDQYLRTPQWPGSFRTCCLQGCEDSGAKRKWRSFGKHVATACAAVLPVIFTCLCH